MCRPAGPSRRDRSDAQALDNPGHHSSHNEQRPAHRAGPTVADNTVGRAIETVCRNELIMIDEIGFAPLDHTGCQLMFRLVADAYDRRAVAIASHSPFEAWGRFLPDQPTAVSLLDRLCHHAHIITTSGDSYRLTHRTTGQGGT